MSTTLGDCRHTSLITETTYMSLDDAVWVEDFYAAVVAPALARYTVTSPSAETLKVTAAVSAAASATINPAVSKNAVVTKLSIGADATKSNIDASGLTELKLDAERDFKHFCATGPTITTSDW